ncbi:D-alanyl-D-alanine carboxypeptidase family protein [Brevundimonas sp. A19_0]|uniref:D-alanyl-D-alanine carboxypeptidase family protein n=1 Tax=Brevundimonas sp. A19_0 TaxID=2821087 RepID=UPI001ADD3EF8|nr:D-alanyl-D-alanine carboxypeptidase family protein [Brevundimonas sp. A19_0]MBO9500716.1 D-alanyl-D-alanine carboxypeptidase family protein [Brevundimonas sp. A19_0]
MTRFATVLVVLLVGLAGPALAQEDCNAGPGSRGIAVANGYSADWLMWQPFDQTERGWLTYLPLIQKEIGTRCAPDTPGFAQALATFQKRYDRVPNGLFDRGTFQVFKGVWQERRPFVMARVADICPEPPPQSELGYLDPDEEHADRMVRLLQYDVLNAYRLMVRAARAEVPEIADNPELLQIFSSYRDPDADTARCATEGNCDGLRRAACSPHRTGTAIDIYVGHLAGHGVDSTRWANRRHQSRGPAYRWLVENAARFGFVPYAYEPWHWEWTGPTTEILNSGRLAPYPHTSPLAGE